MTDSEIKKRFEALEGMVIDQGARIEELEQALQAFAALFWGNEDQAVVQMRKSALGIKGLAGAVVTLAAGEIQIGDQAPVLSGETDLTVANDGDLLGWEYDYGSKQLKVKNFGASVTQESGYVRKWLFKMGKMASGLVYVREYGWMNPTVPASFGDV